MTTLEIRLKVEELKVLKLAFIKKGDFLNAEMLRNRISFYHRQLYKTAA